MSKHYEEKTEAEVLGRIMFDCQRSSFIFSTLKTDDFYLMKNQEIYAEITGMFAAGETVDISTVTLKPKMKQYRDYFLDLTCTVLTAADIEPFVKRLQELKTKRKCEAFSSGLLEKCNTLTGDEIRTEVEAFSISLHDAAEVDGMSDMTDAMKDAGDRYAKVMDGHTRVISTGFPSLDERIYGFEPGCMYVIGARPGVGKSMLMIDLAKKCGKKSIIFSTEMSRSEIADRMISAASGLPLRNMKYADTLKHHHDTIQKAMRQVSGYPIHIDPSPFKTVEQIVSDVRYMKLTTGVDIIFVDYLQYLQVPEAYRGRRIEEVNHISNALKGAAKQLDIPIVVLASMSRFEKEAERKPRPSDLRESGQIESDAHCAILLYRDPKNKGQDPELMELIIGKHRAGPEEPVLLDFYKSICTFTEASATIPEGRY